MNHENIKVDTSATKRQRCRGVITLAKSDLAIGYASFDTKRGRFQCPRSERKKFESGFVKIGNRIRPLNFGLQSLVQNERNSEPQQSFDEKEHEAVSAETPQPGFLVET